MNTHRIRVNTMPRNIPRTNMGISFCVADVAAAMLYRVSDGDLNRPVCKGDAGLIGLRGEIGLAGFNRLFIVYLVPWTPRPFIALT